MKTRLDGLAKALGVANANLDGAQNAFHQISILPHFATLMEQCQLGLNCLRDTKAALSDIESRLRQLAGA